MGLLSPPSCDRSSSRSPTRTSWSTSTNPLNPFNNSQHTKMAPPTYGDLGKSSRDVFGKGYHFSLVKLDVKTKTPSGVEFNAGGSNNTDNGKVSGSLETKYKCPDYGVTFTEKWSTDNQLTTTMDIQDQVLKGLKLTFDSTFSPASGAKSGKIKAEYKHDLVTINSDVDLNLGGPLVNASTVIDGQVFGGSVYQKVNKQLETGVNLGWTASK